MVLMSTILGHSDIVWISIGLDFIIGILLPSLSFWLRWDHYYAIAENTKYIPSDTGLWLSSQKKMKMACGHEKEIIC